jgi:acyl-CoA synthetase (AMP-forming)/AMP-acid ligase II
MPNTIAKVVDIDTGAILGPGQQGELCVSGPQVSKMLHS